MRERTCVVDFKSCSIRPSLKDVMTLISEKMGIDRPMLSSVQMHHVRNCVLVSFKREDAANRFCQMNHLKHSIQLEQGTYKIPVYREDGAIEVRVHDLPQEINKEYIKERMELYGEVLSITDDTWKNFLPGIPNGVKILRMILNRPIPSYVTFEDDDTIHPYSEKSLVTYEKQIATCQWCDKKVHYGSPCVKIQTSEHKTTSLQPKNALTKEQPSAAVPHNQKTNDGTSSSIAADTGSSNAIPKNNEQKIPTASISDNSDTKGENSMDIERVGEDSGSSGSPPRKKLIPRAGKVQQKR